MMNRFAFLVILASFLAAAAGAPVSAQTGNAARVWVSSVTGDDTNVNCGTPQIPCTLLSTALTKVAPNGIVACLDAVSLGQATITRSITVDCNLGNASILVSGVGIVINAGPSDIVQLIGITFDGFHSSPTGIQFNSGGALVVRDCHIRNFNGSNGLGLKFNPTTAATLTIENSTFTGNGSASSGGGLQITANGSGSTLAVLKNVTISGNFVGMGVTSSGQQVITQIINSVISNNKATGIIVAGAGVTATIRRSDITNNAGASSSGPLYSYLDNSIIGNASNTPLTTVGGYQ